MPIAYNPERAFQPARIADVHAELVQEVNRRRREARQNRVNSGRVMPMDVETWEIPDEGSEYQVSLRPNYGTRSHTEL